MVAQYHENVRQEIRYVIGIGINESTESKDTGVTFKNSSVPFCFSLLDVLSLFNLFQLDSGLFDEIRLKCGEILKYIIHTLSPEGTREMSLLKVE